MSQKEKEGSDSYSKRLHSRSERDLSPNKSRRDGKQTTERTYYSTRHLDVETVDRDKKKQRRLLDALPLEIPRAAETKTQSETITQGLEKVDGLHDATNHSSEIKEVPRSRSYFEHDERGTAGNGGRRFDRRTDHRREGDPKEHFRERFRNKIEHQERQSRVDDSRVWRHDGFFELETPTQSARKRPAFREKKIEPPPETIPATNESDPLKLPAAGRDENVRERARHHRGLENRYERQVPRVDDDRNFKRGDGRFLRGGGYQSRERFGDGGGTKGRDRFEGRYGDRGTHRPGGGFQVERWKHDLFDEANRSPKAMKNEEEEIAKVEALLAS